MKRTVGRIVHYVSHGTPPREDGSQAFTSECRAAIITQVFARGPEETAVGLCVLNLTGQFFHQYVPQDESEKLGGTWHWPERVD